MKYRLKVAVVGAAVACVEDDAGSWLGAPIPPVLEVLRLEVGEEVAVLLAAVSLAAGLAEPPRLPPVHPPNARTIPAKSTRADDVLMTASR
ncbi:hypothetical protein CVS29_05300 [Arthrobacter psychrochitiniphilus]|uniref:Uncharacterized protein n=1 Tax=Arthrobacter psychrochitiniphilus TaxID=291045 RepID=A0A2V3E115_9MICC|nr:hypothetical protein CVS29_05300 [Arthrobacter psychrochitiniphilus]